MKTCTLHSPANCKHRGVLSSKKPVKCKWKLVEDADDWNSFRYCPYVKKSSNAPARPVPPLRSAVQNGEAAKTAANNAMAVPAAKPASTQMPAGLVEGN